MGKDVLKDLRRALEVLKKETEQSGDQQIRSALDAAREELENLEKRVSEALSAQMEHLQGVAQLQKEHWTRRERSMRSCVGTLSAELRRKKLETERLAERCQEQRAREQAQAEKSRKLAEKQRKGRRAYRGDLLTVVRRLLGALERQSLDDDTELKNNASVIKHFQYLEDENRQLKIQLLKTGEAVETRKQKWSAAKERLQKTLEGSQELLSRSTALLPAFLQRVKKEEEQQKKQAEKDQKQSERRSFWRRCLCC